MPLDDRLDGFFPQASTQWDALSHYAHSVHGFYNGHTVAQAKAEELMALNMPAHGANKLRGRDITLKALRAAIDAEFPIS